MQYFKMDETVGVRNDALIALLNSLTSTEDQILKNLVANPASKEDADIIRNAKNEDAKVGESKEWHFGLLTDIYEVPDGREAEVGILVAFDDEGGGDERYFLEVWYLQGDDEFGDKSGDSNP